MDYVHVFYNALPRYLINELVRIEKEAMSIIMPGTTYNNACEILGVYTNGDTLFHSIASDIDHRLERLLSPLYYIS